MDVLIALSASLFGILIVLVIFLIVALVLRKIIWTFSPLFFAINYIIWIVYNPLRFVMKNTHHSRPNIIFNLLFYSLIVPFYFIVVHILLTPLRIITALYFDVFVYASVMLSDSVSELLLPRRRGMRKYKTRSTYITAYIVGFPWRLVRFLMSNVLTIVDIIFMFSMGVVLPTLTMYHGTDFNHAVADIAQKGRWKVGGGDYAGLGVYFGITKRTAENYARGNYKKGIIVTRTTLNFTRNGASLNKQERQKIGSDGVGLSHSLSFIWASIEHWRDDGNWWEYCLIHKGYVGDFIKTWRLRPVAFIGDDGKLKRLWGGQANYSINTIMSFIVGVVCTVLLIPYLTFVAGLILGF